MASASKKIKNLHSKAGKTSSLKHFARTEGGQVGKTWFTEKARQGKSTKIKPMGSIEPSKPLLSAGTEKKKSK